MQQKRARTAAAVDGEGEGEGILNDEDFKRIRAEMQSYDEKREMIIKNSRDIQKNSKQAIFSLHRKDFNRAQSQLDRAVEVTHKLLPTIQEQPTLRYGSFSNALEEYAEATIFKHYLETGKLLSATALEYINNEEYLGGVLDFTGELNRFAVSKATSRDIDDVQKCRDLVEMIMDQYLQFDFRNSSLRKKYDALKYTLKNMENMLYELSLTSHGMKSTMQKEKAPENTDDT